MNSRNEKIENHINSHWDDVANRGYGSSDWVEGFREGAKWADNNPASPWIRTEERLPDDNQLVLTSSGIYGTKLLVWNDHYKVWDDEDGDDVYCERDKIDAWMSIPE